MESPTLSQTTDVGERWSTFCGKIQKEQVIYFCQIFIVYTVIVVCLANLCLNGVQHSLWASILSGSVGYILPAPKIRKKKRENVTLLPDATEQQLV